MQRNWGRVIFRLSESALNIPVEMLHYGVTKTANPAISRGRDARGGRANLVVDVASPEASATTGAALWVDGGVVDTSPDRRVSTMPSR